MTTRRMTEQEAHALFLAIRDIVHEVERATAESMRGVPRIVRHDNPNAVFDPGCFPQGAEPLNDFLLKRGQRR